MSTLAVVTSSPPSTEGGHLVIARSLVAAARASGHDAHLVITPDCQFGRQASAYLATWRTDVNLAAGRKIDQVISLRFPSYAVRHPAHVSWLNHTMREYYDLWPRFSASLSPRGRLKERVKRVAIRAVDRWLLTHNVTEIVAQSRTVQRRLADLRVTIGRAAAAAAAACLSVRGIWRLPVCRLAIDAAQASRSRDSRAGGAGRPSRARS